MSNFWFRELKFKSFKIFFVSLIVITSLLPRLSNAQTSSTEIALIRVDQFGYYEDQIKIAVLADQSEQLQLAQLQQQKSIPVMVQKLSLWKRIFKKNK